MVYINENDKNKKQTLNNDNNLKKLSLLLSTAKVTNSFLLSSLNSNCNNTINDALSKTTLASEKISREIGLNTGIIDNLAIETSNQMIEAAKELLKSNYIQSTQSKNLTPAQMNALTLIEITNLSESQIDGLSNEVKNKLLDL